MPKLLRWIGLFQILLIATSVHSWAADAGTDAGATTYATKCAACHAKAGTGNPGLAKVFKVDPTVLDMTKKSTSDKSDADLAKIVKDGVNKMPPYKDKLTDADIASVVTYIRSLAKLK